MNDHPQPSLWRATWIQVERQTIHYNDHPDFDPKDTKAWSDKIKKRFPFNSKLFVGFTPIIMLFLVSFCMDACVAYAGFSGVRWLDDLSTYSVFVVIGLLWGLATRYDDKFWLAIHRITHSLRMVDKKPTWCDADITFHIPIDVSMSWEQGPKLHWQASKEPTTAHASENLPQEALRQLTSQVAFQSGSLEIAQGQFAAELSVDPDHEQELCLELRSVREKTRIHIALTPQDLPTTYQGRPLPAIERHGMSMEPQARKELLQQLALAAQIEGVSLPAQLQQQVQQTIHT